MQRPCDICARTYEAKRASSRYCSGACRKRAQRNPSKPGPAVVALPAASDGELVASVQQELDGAGRLETWQGQAAVDVARRIEGSRLDSGSAYAALHREFRAAMELALKGADAAESAVQRHRDELAARRARKA